MTIGTPTRELPTLERPPQHVTPAGGGAAPHYPIPPIVRRNTLLLAASQAIIGIGSQMIPALAPVMVVRLSGTDALLGVSGATSGISKLLAAYPVGQITDRYGRRAGLLLGGALGLVGALILGTAVLVWSLPLLIAGLLVFGAGVAGTQQLRLAAADMYPPARRAEGLGYVLSGSLVGAVLAPLVVGAAQAAAPAFGIDAAALAWLLVPFTLVPCMLLVAQVRPDPKEIAADLSRYYPGYVPPAPVPGALEALEAPVPPATILDWLREYPKLVAFSASTVAQGTMTWMMTLTSVSLSHHGHDLSAISTSVAIHVVGMFAFSLPLGRLCDRTGRRPVLVGGMVVLATGAILVPATADYWIATAGTFLVGVGWSGASVAASALIADTTEPALRGRAIGVNDTCAAAGSIGFPLLGGPLAAAFGLMTMGALTAAVTIPVMLLAARLRRAA
ncbi:MAG TPA: MFS transporter [Chloroflexota bacterium]|nr:MFS transporter [Chloroflexota bacterium]